MPYGSIPGGNGTPVPCGREKRLDVSGGLATAFDFCDIHAVSHGLDGMGRVFMVDRRTFLRAGAGMAGLAVSGVPIAARAASGGVPWDRLRRALGGDLVLPGDAAYDEARRLASGYFDAIHPQAVAYCRSVADVRACLAFTQDHDIRTAVRSGGHSAAGYSTTTGLVLDVSRLNAIEVGDGTVTLGPGAQGVDVLAALAPHGLAAVTGNCPTVCAGGYLSGGGVGPLSRAYGVAADRLLAADVVLADGRLAHCSADREPDLFWALRGGGGGNFGVVTRYVVRPAALPRLVTFSLVWPWDKAADVIAAYLPWQAQAPDDLTANVNVLLANAAPGAVPTLSVSGGRLGGGTAGLDPYLDAFVSAVGAAPTSRDVEDQTYDQALMRQFNCADKTVEECHRVGTSPEAVLPRQNFVADRGRLLDRPPDRTGIGDALSAFEAAPADGQFRAMGFSGLGGAINRPRRTATAYVHRDARFYVSYTVSLHSDTPAEAQRDAAESWVDGGFAVARRYGDESQLNFIDPRLDDWRSAYYAENLPRLSLIKRRYDPHGYFRFAQSL